MDKPIFPQEFIEKHCGSVREARYWRKHYHLPPDPDDELAHAQCEFYGQGSGLGCTNCDVWLRRPFLNNKVDEKWLPVLEKFYSDMKIWEKEQKEVDLKIGSYI